MMMRMRRMNYYFFVDVAFLLTLISVFDFFSFSTFSRDAFYLLYHLLKNHRNHPGVSRVAFLHSSMIPSPSFPFYDVIRVPHLIQFLYPRLFDSFCNEDLDKRNQFFVSLVFSIVKF